MSSNFQFFDRNHKPELPAKLNFPERSEYSTPIERSAQIRAAKLQREFDIIVIGGGVHGAAVTWAAAANGMRVLLLERGDFASETSSRLSDTAHGGLRYIPMFDFAQVFEGIKAREELFKVAAHAVEPINFEIPIYRGGWWLRAQLKAGLPLYDLFCQSISRKHKWVPSSKMDPDLKAKLARDPLGSLRYCDGIMRSTRLVFDNLRAANDCGAITLNHAEALNITRSGPQSMSSVEWRDTLSGEHQHTKVRLVINCAGPWATFIPGVHSDYQQRFSQGTHLIFNVKWNHSALFLPMKEPGRFYFVWPHEHGTMVGTTEREVKNPISDPVPLQDEVDEILARIAIDLPHANLTAETLISKYAGIRSIPERKATGKSTSQLSRRHLFDHHEGILTLLGGKFTTAARTAHDLLCQAYTLLGDKKKPEYIGSQIYPSTRNLEYETKRFTNYATELGCSKNIISAATKRLGSAVRYLPILDPQLELITGKIFKAEVLYYLRYEQAEKLEDVMVRRLRAHLSPSHGKDLLDEISKIIYVERPDYKPSEDLLAYRKRYQ